MRNKKKKSNNARKSTPYRQWWRSSSSPPFSSPTSSQHDIAKPPAVNVSSKTNPQLTSRGTNYGIKVLYDGASEEIGVDIVLVHGLTGNAFNTWYHKDSDTHWPTKLLKQDIPEARILTFGYDANLERLHEPRTLSRLTNHAEELVDQLERLRRGESKNDNNTNTNPSSSFRQSSKLSSRKICFVAHSLGGLLTAQALSFSRRSAERHLQQIERCTVSVVFLGVPNCGSDWAKWANFASKLRWIIGGRSVRTELTNTLKPNSEMLILIQKNFQNLLRFREREGCGISLACLYEKKPIWNGKVVVTQQSASIPGYPSYGVDANHKEMAIFADRNNEGYKKIVSELQRWRELPVCEDVANGAQENAERAPKNVLNCVFNQTFNYGRNTQTDTEQPVKPSEHVCTIPIRRDADFISRKKLLDQIHQKSALPASRVALVGLGGVGKTQLAIEYGYQVAEQSPERWILWIYAGSTARVEKSYFDIADFLRIPGRKASKVNILELVHNWLRNENNGKWLLIVDNIDDSYMQSSKRAIEDELERAVAVSGNNQPNMEAFYASIPQSRNGSVLVTTRNRGMAYKMVEEKEIIEIEPMIEVEAIELFARKLRIEENVEEIARLSKILEYMPLAIVQAASYISQRTPRYSVKRYLEEYQERQNDSKVNSLFCVEGGRLRRDVDAKMSIVITWLITVEHIMKFRQSAAILLALMSFFDRQGIPEESIRARMEFVAEAEGQQHRQQSEEGRLVLVDGGEAFEDDVLVLKNYSLIKENNYQSFEMHRMVQNAALDWLEYKGLFDFIQYHFISGLYIGFPNGHYETWTKCRVLFPHVKSTLIQRPKAEGALVEWSCLLIKAARYAYLRGKYKDTECFIELVLEIRLQTLNAAAELTIESFNLAALAYLDQERWFQAEEILVQGLEMSREVWGEEHVVTMSFMGYLTRSYLKQEKWDLAEDLQRKMAAITNKITNDSEQSNEARDYNRKTASEGLLSAFIQQENCEEKLDWRKDMLEVMNLQAEDPALELLQPANDQSTSDSPLEKKTILQLLASTLFQQGKYDEALEAWKRALELMEGKSRKGGHDLDSEVLQIKHDQASTYMQKRDLQKAMDLFEEVLAGRKKCLGENHPLTITTMLNMAALKKAFGQFQESKSLFEEAFRLRKSCESENDNDNDNGNNDNDNDKNLADLTMKDVLIAVYIELDEWNKAEELHREEVLELTISLYGENSPQTLQCYYMLAAYLYRLDRDSEAMKMLRNCHRLRSEVLGPEHADTQLCLTFMGNLEAKMKNDEDGKRKKKEEEEEEEVVVEVVEVKGEEEEEEKKVASKDVEGRAIAIR